jgi:hypothetical protein
VVERTGPLPQALTRARGRALAAVVGLLPAPTVEQGRDIAALTASGSAIPGLVLVGQVPQWMSPVAQGGGAVVLAGLVEARPHECERLAADLAAPVKSEPGVVVLAMAEPLARGVAALAGSVYLAAAPLRALAGEGAVSEPGAWVTVCSSVLAPGFAQTNVGVAAALPWRSGFAEFLLAASAPPGSQLDDVGVVSGAGWLWRAGYDLHRTKLGLTAKR